MHNTCPPSAFIHTVDGYVDANGNAVGYHHVSGRNGRVVAVIDPPDTNGVYTAAVDIWDSANGIWVSKTMAGSGGQRRVNSMFPSNWTSNQILDNINSAMASSNRQLMRNVETPRNWRGIGGVIRDWITRQPIRGISYENIWRGRSHGGVVIEWIVRDGRMITAYPIYGG
ncbi:MAG: EndoU domain-containing protein [Aggregatilineales bacterium]